METAIATGFSVINVAVKVNPRQAYDRDPSDNIGDSDNNNSQYLE